MGRSSRLSHTSSAGEFRLPASIEITPKQMLDSDGIAALVPAGTRIYITDVGTDPFDRLLSAARTIADQGCIAVPHIPARRLTSEQDLFTRIGRLADEAGVREALLIAGSPNRQQGPYASSMDILETGIFDRHGFRRIGVAGHPEGSPDITDADITKALQAKNRFADRSDADFYIVTQFGFDAESMIAWAEGLHAIGNALPVHMGIAGPAKITTLLKYAAMCGVGASMGFLTKRASALTTLAMRYSPDTVADPLERHVSENSGSSIEQLHVYPFGGVRQASAWLTERGNWFQPQSSLHESVDS